MYRKKDDRIACWIDNELANAESRVHPEPYESLLYFCTIDLDHGTVQEQRS